MNTATQHQESAGAAALREGLAWSMQEQRRTGELPPLSPMETPMPPGDLPAVRLAGESIEALREEIHAAARLAAKEAASQVVSQLLTPERARELFLVFFAVLQEQLTSGAGKWMLGGIGRALRVGLWAALAVVALLILGGPALLKALAATFWSHITKS